MSEEVVFYLRVAFWGLFFLLALCYVIFPVTLPFVSELFKRRRRDIIENFDLPTVSLLISAFNEEGVIERKIQNILEIDYPKEKLEVLIGDDGSADRTAEIIARYADKGITLVKAPKNAGKAAMLNRLQKIAKGEILVFCDANTMFFPNVVRKLVAPFEDRKIGCVCGHLILSDKSGSMLGQGESSYWDLESEIKKFEGILDRLIGGNGALYAIRRNLYTELPVKKSVMDDFFITTKILQKGYFCTFVASAIGTEQLTGFKSQFSMLYGQNNENYFVKVDRGIGINRESKLEGYKDHNLFVTQILGPILPLNPEFCEYLISLTGEKATAAFKEEAMDAYNQRVKEFSDPKIKFE